MKKKNLLLLISALLFLAVGLGLFYINKTEEQQGVNTAEAVKNTKPANIITKKPLEEQKNIKANNETLQADLYSEYADKVQMSSVSEISKSNDTVKEQFAKILENCERIYFVKLYPESNETVILSESQNNSKDKYQRHNLLLTTITSDNIIKNKRFGYEGLEGETENAVMQKSDIWVYDETIEPKRPLSHTVYGKGKKIIFTETWNYSEENPIKYELKNYDGKTLSVLKETIDNGVDYRKEHIFYDKDGNIEMSVSASYEGADLKRLNYYDSKSPQDSFIIENVYENGLKTEEKVYDSNLQIVETINASYNNDNDELQKLRVNDPEGREIEVIEQITP